ncbi:lycopene cyclase family protein [Deinococcus taeanensis]|uniref:lycopene cyclase family protein n=1 Tax=Deinococcus taeanensis TaxID=2737050 RepID=UPI001CDB5EF8|nr:lycopene cyclase family protein [Deinococcus taeanensis]UBV43926.1 lycopene cyclase family protein [Deinococcus taeanensis]
MILPADTHALIIGGGPAALAMTGALRGEGLSVRVITPHAPTAFPATYGAWLDDLPGWARSCAAHVWTDVRVYTGPEPTPLLRPYALLDNARLLRALLARASGSVWTCDHVLGAQPAGALWAVTTRSGVTYRAAFLVDASGHHPVLQPPVHPGGAALQTAYGLTARFERPPSPPGAMVWMDHRAPHGPHPHPTFLYAMHLGGDRYFVEETSLIARPAPTRSDLRGRLHARLRAQGTPPGEILAEEWVSFPMNAAAPAAHGPLAFGAAGGMVHPISGFQVTAALRAAPLVARAAAAALAGGDDPHRAAWAALWPAPRRAERDVHLLGVQALLTLPPEALSPFFQAFFALPAEQWRAFLDPGTPAGTLARIMLRLFVALPARARLPLTRAALARPRSSVTALRAAMKVTSRVSHPLHGAVPQAERMTHPDLPLDDDTRDHEDTSQTEPVTEGMQGSTGSTDANGLDPNADLGEKVEELRENLRAMTRTDR